MKQYFFSLLAVLLLAVCFSLPASVSAAAGDAAVKEGWVTEGDSTYYYRSGKTVRGWQKIKKKWYFFDKKTKTLMKDGIAGDKKKGFYYVDEDGIRVDDPTMNAAVKFILKNTKKADTPKEKLLACYDYFTDKCFYRNAGYSVKKKQLPKYGKMFLVSGRGNCYMGSSAVCYCAKALGYETRLGVGNSYKGPTAHGWAEVKMGKDWYLFDINRTRWIKKYNFRMVKYEDYPVTLRRKRCYALKVKNGKVSWKKSDYS